MTAASSESVSALDDLVRRVPGVTTLYRSTSVLVGIAAATIAVVHPSAADDSLVLIEENEGAFVVTATIGTEGDSAARICREVHDVISSHLRGTARGEAVIRVTVAYAAD